MKLQLIKTKESDGNWYKIYYDDRIKACIKIDTTEEGEETALRRATEIYDFLKENKGQSQIIKEDEV